MTNFRHEGGGSTTDAINIKEILRVYLLQFYVNKLKI